MKALLLALLLVGCVPKPVVVYQTAELRVPSRPVLPTVSGAELQCLSDDAYTRLVVRERAIQRHVEMLESLIESTAE